MAYPGASQTLYKSLVGKAMEAASNARLRRILGSESQESQDMEQVSDLLHHFYVFFQIQSLPLIEFEAQREKSDRSRL